MFQKLTRKELRRTLRVLNKNKGDRVSTARELGIGGSTLRERLSLARQHLPNVHIPTAKGGPPRRSPELVAEAAEAYRVHGSQRKAAMALGISPATFQHRLEDAAIRTDWKPRGSVGARRAKKLPLPKAGEVTRYILTCAQSGTKLHDPTYDALRALAEHYGARLLISTFTYNRRQEGSAKRGTQTNIDRGTEWYDPRIEPHVCDDMVALAPSLIFNGHMNILPTAVDPLSGMSNYNGRCSSIFPHVKVAMTSIATMADAAAKLQYTTGTVTQYNYIQKKAGQKAEFDHVYGGLMVEVDSNGSWWVRQLNVDSKGRLYDLDLCVMPDGDIVPSIGAAALVFGDLHEVHLDGETIQQRWGKGGMVAKLQPAVQFAHDVLDMESRGHHSRRDPHKMYQLHVQKRESVAEEVDGVGNLLSTMAEHSLVVVVNSNHDRHLERWLKEADWRSDPVNADFYIDCQAAYLGAIRAGRHFDALKWAVTSRRKLKGVRFLEPGQSFIVCRDNSGGIELGLHGDRGPGGVRGSLRNLSRIGRKVVIGHSHAAGIFNGAYQTGVSAPVEAFDYARGAPNAWSHTDCVVYPNGKRTLVTWWKGRWRA